MEEKRRPVTLLAIPLLLLLLLGLKIFMRVGVPALERRQERNSVAAFPEPAEPEAPLPPAPAPASRVAAPEPPKTLSPAINVQGRVMLVDGRPAPFAKVDFFVVDLANNRVVRQTTADANGMFELPCPRHLRAVHTAHVAGAGRALDFEPIFPSDSSGTKCDYVIHLHRETVASGYLENADGIPVAGATLRFHPFRVSTSNQQEFGMRIFVDPEDETWWKEWVLTDCEVTSDEIGDFRAPSLWSGIHYVVEVRRDGHKPEFIPVHSLRGTLRLRLSK